MNPRMLPTACFDFEPEEAKELVWLPLAVRYKLDVSGLRIGFDTWQALPLARRSLLMSLPVGPEFENEARRAGASPAMPQSCDIPPLESAAEVLCCGLLCAARWLTDSTAFSRYVLAKRAAQRCH